MSLNFSIDSILGNEQQQSDANNGSTGSSATGARSTTTSTLTSTSTGTSTGTSSGTSTGTTVQRTSTASTGSTSLDDEHVDACGSGAESVASCSTGSAMSSKTSGSFGFELDQFSSLGDLSQLSKFPYLQRFSRLYVGTPEPNSCASNESKSDPVIANTSRASGTLAGPDVNSLLPGTSGLSSLSSLLQSQHEGHGEHHLSASGAERLQMMSNEDFNNAFLQGLGNKDAPLCTKCKLHGIRNEVKGHKKKCPMKDCRCELCILTDYGKRLRGKKAKKAGPSNQAGATSSALGDELRMGEPSELIQTNVALILDLLKERLQHDGLEYQQEVAKLKDAVLYLLFKQFDKRKLYSKFIN